MSDKPNTKEELEKEKAAFSHSKKTGRSPVALPRKPDSAKSSQETQDTEETVPPRITRSKTRELGLSLDSLLDIESSDPHSTLIPRPSPKKPDL